MVRRYIVCRKHRVRARTRDPGVAGTYWRLRNAYLTPMRARQPVPILGVRRRTTLNRMELMLLMMVVVCFGCTMLVWSRAKLSRTRRSNAAEVSSGFSPVRGSAHVPTHELSRSSEFGMGFVPATECSAPSQRAHVAMPLQNYAPTLSRLPLEMRGAIRATMEEYDLSHTNRLKMATPLQLAASAPPSAASAPPSVASAPASAASAPSSMRHAPARHARPPTLAPAAPAEGDPRYMADLRRDLEGRHYAQPDALLLRELDNLAASTEGRCATHKQLASHAPHST